MQSTLFAVLKRLPRVLIALALAASIGLHWTLLQSVAWVGMVVTYSQKATFTQAIEKTFNGKHPCSLCKQIAKGKHSEKKTDTQVEVGKLLLYNPGEHFAFFSPRQFYLLGASADSAPKLPAQPLLPPPRLT